MIKKDSSCLAKKVFNWDLSIKNKNWSSKIEKIFDDLDLLPIFMNQNMSNNIPFWSLNTVQERGFLMP